MKALTWIVALILVATLIFAIVNRDPVTVDFWPIPVRLDLPVFATWFAALAIGFVLGGLVSLGAIRRARRAAREQRRRAEIAEAEIATLRRRQAEAGGETGGPTGGRGGEAQARLVSIPH